MNSKISGTKLRALLPPLGALLLLVAFSTQAQVPVDENGRPLDALATDSSYEDAATSPDAILSELELEELAGPVALYPDDLLAIVLPASTYPLEIVQAARFLEQLESDNSLQPDESWDESITALLNYPEVIRMMDEDIDWAWRLGEAVIAQQAELIAAIESFRDRAYAAGNLKSDEHQDVKYDDGIIEIVPVNEEIIYVPYYEPEQVVVHQPRRVYYYYPQSYPVYYYPYPVGHHFSSGYFWGVTTAFSIGWNSRYLHVYHPSYWGHPYYGRSYYSHYYRRPSINVYNSWYVNNSYRNTRFRYRDGDYWRPRYRSGARPDDQRVRNYHQPSSSSRDQRSREGRSRLQTRNNGRMSLGLRERNANRSAANDTRAPDRSRSPTRSRTDQVVTNRRSAADGGHAASARSNRSGSATSAGGRQSPIASQGSTRQRSASQRSNDARESQRLTGQRRPATTSDNNAASRSRSATDGRITQSRNRTSVTPPASVARNTPTPTRNTNRRATTQRESAPQRRTETRATAPPARAPTTTRHAPPSRDTAHRSRAASSASTAPASRVSAPARRQAPRTATPNVSAAASGRRDTATRKRKQDKRHD